MLKQIKQIVFIKNSFFTRQKSCTVSHKALVKRNFCLTGFGQNPFCIMNHEQNVPINCSSVKCCILLIKRNTSSQPSDLLWNQWLAGLIDGDGCFFISKQGQISLEITVALDDSVMLQQIKQKTGGTVKLRSGSKSVRLRIFRKQQLIDVIHRVNGHIRLEVRQQQLKKVCSCLNLVFLQPSPLVLPNGYIAGLFDADGSVTIGLQRTKSVNSIKSGLYGKYIRLTEAHGYNQLSLHIVNLDRNLLLQVQQCLGFGQLISEQISVKRPNKLTKYYFRSYDHVMRWLELLKCAPLRSQKHVRCKLLNRYFELKFNKAHLASCGPQFKAWQAFCRKWFNIKL